MYPISTDIRSLPQRSPSTTSTTWARGQRVVPLRPERTASMERTAAPVDADVEVEIRLFADGRSITVQRRLAPGPDGQLTTVGIDALVR